MKNSIFGNLFKKDIDFVAGIELFGIFET